MLQSEITRFAEALSALAEDNPKAREVIASFGAILTEIAGSSRGSSRRRSAPPERAPAAAKAATPEQDWDSNDGSDEGDGDRDEQRDVSLELISRRCRVKAESCRWAIERRQIMDSSGENDERIAPRDAELIERARSYDNCFVWALHPYADLPDDHQLEVIAGCYECLATAVESMLEIDRLNGNREIQQEAMQLVAAAQSALRKSLFDGGRRQRDPDQEDAFHWLKDQTGRRRIYVARHMRLMDPADPETWESRIEAGQQLVEQLETDNEEGGDKQRMLNRIRYHAARIDSGDGGTHDWERLDDIVRTLLEQHDLAPSDPALLESLELAVDLMPDDFEPGTPLRITLKETEQWLDSFEDEDDDSEDDFEDDESVTAEETAR